MDDDTLRVAAEIAKLDQPIALLEALFSSFPYPLQIYDAEGYSVLTNRAFFEYFGSTPPPGYNVLHDEIAARHGFSELIRRAYAGEVITSPPHWYDPRELEHVHVEVGQPIAQVVTLVPLRDRDGHLSHVAMFHRDVTAELAARDQAEADRRRLAILADAAATLSSTLDVDHIAQQLGGLVLPRFCDACTLMIVDDEQRLVRVASSSHDAQTDAMLCELHQRHSVAIPRKLADVMNTNELIEFDDYSAWVREAFDENDPYRTTIAKAELRNALVAPVRGRDRTLGVVGFAMTAASGRSFSAGDRVLAEQLGQRIGLALDNAQLYARVKDADRRKDEFLAVLGHELRNPLAPIVSALHLMSLRYPDVAPREREVIARQVNHMSRLVDDLLDVSRITRGKIELARERLDLADVVARAIELTQPLIDDRRHDLRIEISRGLEIHADFSRMTQLLSNLMQNAAKYTPSGGHLVVRGRRDRDTAVLEVEDDGPGIPAARLASIFELFVQGEDHHEGGLGIGLALVKSLVAMHGGAVTAENVARGGALFRVRVPALVAAVPDVLCDDPVRQIRDGAGGGRRVLLVDDNRDALEMLAEMLAGYGFDVRTAADGLAALEVAATQHPEIAILDIGLPVIDGYELARRLRVAHAAPLRLIALTGYGQKEDRARTRAAGFDVHLVKPVNIEALLRELTSVASAPTGIPIADPDGQGAHARARAASR